MKYNYLLIISVILCHQGMAQQLDAMASLSEQAIGQQQHRSNRQSLKQGLQAIEKTYQVSIAYKDYLVDGKVAPTVSTEGRTVEESLRHLLKDTGLQFEKANEAFYVVFQKRDPQASKRSVSSFSTAALLAQNGPTVPDHLINPQAFLKPNLQTFEITIRGRVTDENNQPIPGVNVLIKGTSRGASTDVNGQYTISVDNENSVLIFSYVGYMSQEITVGGRTVIDVTLSPDLKALEEVVVTALGIEKSSRSLGYATSKVESSELTINRTPNLMNSLQGKIAGVNISSLGTGPGGTSKIRIRGQSSITGQNNPLIVINGVPIDNTNFGTNPNNQGADGSVGTRGGGITADGGDGLLSINPDDIESMTVLKGAAAAALYGSRAKDGVIMITTKTRGEGQGIGITYNLNYTSDIPLDFTDYQYEYGQGELGVRPTTPNPTSGQWSFGEKFQPGMTQILFDGVEVPYVPQRDIIKKFFRTGQTVTNSVTLSSNSDKGGFNLSVADMNSKGITPNNKYNRKTINMGFDYSLSEKLGLKGTINYSNEYNQNPPNVGNQDNTIPVALYNMANSMPLDLLNEKKYNAQGNEFIYSRFMNRTNPYFTLAEQFNNIRRDRVFGNLRLRYDLTPWLFVQGRVGQDYWSRLQDYNNFPTGQASRAAAPAGFVNGQFTQEARTFREINADFLIGAQREFGKIGTNITFGGNHMYRRSDVNSAQATDFVVRDLYTIQNGRVKDPFYDLVERGVNSLYGSLEFNIGQTLFLSGTLRNDWFSTLSAENRSILYPSVSLGYVFTESLGTTPNWLSFGKLRAAYAEVGSDSDVAPYSNLLFYGINNNLFPNPSGAFQPVGGPAGNTIPNPTLRPMRVGETELGLELRMFNNRVGLDVAVYQKITTDQIVQAQVSDASGYVNTNINSGKSRNRGIEMLLNLVPVETSNFTWNFTFNGAYNITKVLSLLTDTPGERITVGTHIFNGELRHVVGEELGQVAGFGYVRDSQGRVVYGPNGIANATTSMLHYGSALPNWVGGFTNSFNYRGITASFLIDFKLGNTMISGTNFNAYRHGLHKETLAGREEGVVGVGVKANSQGEILGENDIVVFPVQPFYEVVRSKGLVEPIVYDGGYWKLRQITIGYDLTKYVPKNWPFRAVRLDLVANNVLMLKKWVPNIDPESFGYTSDNLVGLESTGVPTTRSIGFNLNVKL